MVKYFEIGKIVNTFGIKGQLKVVPYTDDMERFEELDSIYIEKKKELKLFHISDVKYSKNVVLLKLDGIETIEQAQEFKNCMIKIDRKDARKLPEGTYFIADLIGLDVYTDENLLLGKVDDIFNNGSSDIYVVKDEMGKQVLLPAIPEVITNVDLDKSIITVHIIKGLL